MLPNVKTSHRLFEALDALSWSHVPAVQTVPSPVPLFWRLPLATPCVTISNRRFDAPFFAAWSYHLFHRARRICCSEGFAGPDLLHLVPTYLFKRLFEGFLLFIYRPTWAALDSPAPSTPCARSTSSMLWVAYSRMYHMDALTAGCIYRGKIVSLADLSRLCKHGIGNVLL